MKHHCLALRTAHSVWLVLAALGAGACSESPSGEPAGGGTGGGGGSSAECRPRGTGAIEITVTGLPEGVAAALVAAGPVEAIAVEASRTLLVSAGAYELTAERVATPDPIVRALYEPTLSESAFCLGTDETRAVEVSYAQIVTSQRLWTNNSNGTGSVLAFSARQLETSGEEQPGVVASAAAGKDVAFDKQGNLWSMGASVADPHLLRFPASAWQASGEKQPDRSFEIEGIACVPALRAFAFDRDGGLWLSSCGSGVLAVPASALEASGSISPAVVIGGLTDNGDLAFDFDGNLWLTSDQHVLRYDAARLTESIDAPDLTLAVRATADSGELSPSNLAFDAAGNLWLVDFGSNQLASLSPGQLAASGQRTALASVTLTLGVAALLERPAFDESGGLWLALDQDRFGRLAPEQLGTSSDAGAPTIPETIITSPGMGNANRMAFFPAPGALPLYHRFR